MKKTILYLSLIMLFSCNDKKESRNNIDILSVVKNEFKTFKINADFSYVNDFSKYKNGIIHIELQRPYRMSQKKFQDAFISYIARKLYLDYKMRGSVCFEYKIDSDEIELINVFDDKFIPKFKRYNEAFINLLEYCFTNFQYPDDYVLDKNFEIFSQMFPKAIKKDDFLNTLYLLSFSKKPSIYNNADRLVIFYHSYANFLLNKYPDMQKEKKEERLKEIHYLEDFWKIAKGTDIQDEKDFLKQVEALAQP